MPEKPETAKEYGDWLWSSHGIRLGPQDRTYYDVASRSVRDQLRRSEFWSRLHKLLPEFDDSYLSIHGLHLLMSRGEEVEISLKPFASAVDKSFRRNVLLNDSWPDSPSEGWVFPSNWLQTLKDIIRTSLVVKYLDGVTYLADRIEELGIDLGLNVEVDYEAREEGYYAAHVYVSLPAEVPLPKWDTEEILFRLELQVTTQMQEAIRVLTHPFYAARRSTKSPNEKKWQWNYQSDEFRANYLAHTLHHIEGLIMDIRARGENHGG